MCGLLYLLQLAGMLEHPARRAELCGVTAELEEQNIRLSDVRSLVIQMMQHLGA